MWFPQKCINCLNETSQTEKKNIASETRFLFYNENIFNLN